MPQKKQPKVSILVPCYNVEKYLEECLDSIVNQTLKDIEIICINDGSTDSTLKIIKKYATKDKRFVVIDKKNGGYGHSMNKGLDAATGEYVGIVESDDWVEPDAFEFLYNLAKKNKADLAKAEYAFFDNDTREETKSWGIGLDKNLNDKVFCPTEKNPEIIWTGHPSIWTCLYSRKMLEDKHIRFAETAGAAFQDMGFKPKTFIASKRFVYSPQVILHYRKHANNSDKNNNKVFAVCDAHDDTDAWLEKYYPNDLALQQIAETSRFSNYVWNLRRLSGIPKRDFRKRFTDEFMQYYKIGKLNKTHYDSKAWLKLYTVIYPHNPLWGILRAMTVIISPVWKVRIRDGYKKTLLLNVICIRKQKLAVVKK